MNLIDTNAINHVLGSNLRVRETYYLAPDVREESEITEIVHGRRLSTNFKDASLHWLFDGRLYIQHYKDMLNRHSGRSFYNMTGFGDISILALIATIRDANTSAQPTLFPETERAVSLYTEDGPLIKKIEHEFNRGGSGFKVTLLGNPAIT